MLILNGKRLIDLDTLVDMFETNYNIAVSVKIIGDKGYFRLQGNMSETPIYIEASDRLQEYIKEHV